VRLLEGFVARAELSDCTQLALQWLAEVLGFTRSICLVRPEADQSLFVVGSLTLMVFIARDFFPTVDSG